MGNITLNFRPNEFDLVILKKLSSELHLEKRTDILRKAIETYDENITILTHKKDFWEEARKKTNKGSYNNISFTIEECVWEKYISTIRNEFCLQKPRITFLVRNALYALNCRNALKKDYEFAEIENDTTLLLKASIEKVCEMITTDVGIQALKEFIQEVY